VIRLGPTDDEILVGILLELTRSPPIQKEKRIIEAIGFYEEELLVL
jgi:hypothetical protein